MVAEPIRNDADHARAIERIEALWHAEPGTPEHDEIEILGVLVDAYEAKRWPIDPPDPVEAIRARMEQVGYTQAQFAELIGSRSRASEILRRKRYLTIEMAWKLNRSWGIPAESLIKPYKLERKGA